MGRDEDPHAWAVRDVDRLLGLFLLLLLAGLHVVFLYVLLAVVAGWGAWLLVKARRRRQLERANEHTPFWLDRLNRRTR